MILQRRYIPYLDIGQANVDCNPALRLFRAEIGNYRLENPHRLCLEGKKRV
jgi:hypothetical protein